MSYFDIKIIDNTAEKIKEHACLWGGSCNELTEKHIEALKEGKALTWSDGEYTHFLVWEGNMPSYFRRD